MQDEMQGRSLSEERKHPDYDRSQLVDAHPEVVGRACRLEWSIPRRHRHTDARSRWTVKSHYLYVFLALLAVRPGTPFRKAFAFCRLLALPISDGARPLCHAVQNWRHACKPIAFLQASCITFITNIARSMRIPLALVFS